MTKRKPAPKSGVFAASVALVLALSLGLSSETLTFTTTYPSPAGVYKNLTTTQNSLLARDGGNVGVGTSTPDLVAPDGVRAGNLGVHDLFLRSTGAWASMLKGQSASGSDTSRLVESKRSWLKVPGSEVRLTTRGGKVLLMGTLDAQPQSSSGWWHITIGRDGTPLHPSGSYGLATNVESGMRNVTSSVLWLDSPSAGAHSYALYFRRGDPWRGYDSANIRANEASPAVLVALELAP